VKRSIEQSVENLRQYLRKFDEDRRSGKLIEKYNQNAFAGAREWAAWLSVFDFGITQYSKMAGKLINRWW